MSKKHTNQTNSEQEFMTFDAQELSLTKFISQLFSARVTLFNHMADKGVNIADGDVFVSVERDKIKLYYRDIKEIN